MNSNSIIRNSNFARTLILAIFLHNLIIAQVDVEIIKNPKYTVEEKYYSKLSKVNEIKENISDDFFLVKPTSIAADKMGNVYVFDSKQAKILKYSNGLRLSKAYGEKGKGPGEFGTIGPGITRINLYLGKDHLLYCGDRFNKRIYCFDLDLNIKYSFKPDMVTLPYLIPVTDGSGNFFIYPDNEGLLDVINIKKGKTATLLDNRDLRYGLFYKVATQNNIYFYKPGPTNVQYDLSVDNKLLVFLSTSGILYILEDNKLLKKLKLWPKKALEMYKNELGDAIKDGGFMPYFPKLFTDKDNGKYFYLYFGKPSGTDKTLLYKFDLDGNLISVLYIIEKSKYAFTKPLCKMNGLFYTIGLNDETEETIAIYKEVKK